MKRPHASRQKEKRWHIRRPSTRGGQRSRWADPKSWRTRQDVFAVFCSFAKFWACAQDVHV